MISLILANAMLKLGVVTFANEAYVCNFSVSHLAVSPVVMDVNWLAFLISRLLLLSEVLLCFALLWDISFKLEIYLVTVYHVPWSVFVLHLPHVFAVKQHN